LFDSLGSESYFKNFYARRFLRISPLYYGFLLLLLLLAHPLKSHWSWPRVIIFLGYLQNLPFGLREIGHGSIFYYTNHLWSLAVEEQFYLLWPLFVFLIHGRKKLMNVALALAGFALGLRIFLILHGGLVWIVPYKFTPCRMDSLLIGAWLALAMRGKNTERILNAARFLLPTALSLMTIIVLRTGNFDWITNRSVNLIGYSLSAVASASLIALSLRPDSLAERLFDVGWLRFLGKYSYGIYVWHLFIAELIGVGPRLYLDRHLHSKALGLIGSAFLIGCISILVALLSYHLYEVQFLRFKKYFNYSSSKRPSPDALIAQ